MKKKLYILPLFLTLNSVAQDTKIVPTNKPTDITKPAAKVDDNKPIVVKVVEGKVLLNNSKEGKEIENKLMNVRKSLEADIIKLQQSIESDIKTLQSKAQLMTADTLEIEQERVMKKKKEHELKVNQAQEDLNRHLQRELGKFNKKVLDLVVDWGKSNSCDIVVLAESGEVIYRSDRVDATNDIMQILNKKFDEEKKKQDASKKAAQPSKVEAKK